MVKEYGTLTEVNDNDLKLLQNNPKKFWKGVKIIGEAAFSHCLNLKEIVIPKSVKQIDELAFLNCSSLERIKLPEGLTEISWSVFSDCTNLQEIVIPKSVKQIGSGAFYNCSSLERVVLPDGLTEIRGDTFYNCSKLKEIVIPKSVEQIGFAAFYDCSSLEKIELPKNLIEIDKEIFCNCSNLKKVVIPNTVNIIREGAFRNCSSLQEIVIPNSVIIADEVFNGCSNLKRIQIPKKIRYKKDVCFSGISPEAIIQYRDRTFKQGIISLDEQLNIVLNADEQELESTITLLNNNLCLFFIDSFVDDLTVEEIKSFNPKLWKNLTNKIFETTKEPANMTNLQDLFRLARNLGLFDEERMITIKNGQGKDTQVHVNELAFNFLQKFTKDVPIDRMHIHLSSMYAKGINEEFIKFISNKVNYDDIITNIDKNDSILTNIYNWFVERASLENLTDIERDDNLTNTPTSEKNRYRVRTYEAGENGVDKTRWKAPTVELIIKDLAEKKFTGITTTREREIAENLVQVTDYQQEHFDKAVEIDKEREESKVPDYIVGKHIGQNRTQAYKEYAEKTEGIKDKILNEAGQIINNQVDISNKIFTYDTLAKSDLANFSIGFMTSCCARLYGAGAGAMRAAIIHKDMQPLVVRNDKDEIVAYSIMYINREKGYAVLNDIEVNKKYEGQEKQLKIIYDKMRRCAIENIEEYNKTALVPITKLNCGISPNWTAVNENIKKNPQSSILKAPNFDDFKYTGSGSWSGDWHNAQWTIWEDDEIEK